eukprot:3195416-Amphidinium_carterae.1
MPKSCDILRRHPEENTSSLQENAISRQLVKCFEKLLPKPLHTFAIFTKLLYSGFGVFLLV